VIAALRVDLQVEAVGAQSVALIASMVMSIVSPELAPIWNWPCWCW
jgi:hypothetical protein